jgi:hypothetical protein
MRYRAEIGANINGVEEVRQRIATASFAGTGRWSAGSYPVMIESPSSGHPWSSCHREDAMDRTDELYLKLGAAAHDYHFDQVITAAIGLLIRAIIRSRSTREGAVHFAETIGDDLPKIVASKYDDETDPQRRARRSV